MAKKKQNPHIESALTKLGQDQELLDSVIEVIVEQWPAEERLLKKAFTENDFDQLRKSFHTLSGSVSYFSTELSKEFHDLSDRAAERTPIATKNFSEVINELDELIVELANWQRLRK